MKSAVGYLSVRIAHEDHLLQQPAIWSGLGHDLPEDKQQLFDGMVLQRQDKTYDGHQKPRQLFTIQNHNDHLLQGLCLQLDISFF